MKAMFNIFNVTIEFSVIIEDNVLLFPTVSYGSLYYKITHVYVNLLVS